MERPLAFADALNMLGLAKPMSKIEADSDLPTIMVTAVPATCAIRLRSTLHQIKAAGGIQTDTHAHTHACMHACMHTHTRRRTKEQDPGHSSSKTQIKISAQQPQAVLTSGFLKGLLPADIPNVCYGWW